MINKRFVSFRDQQKMVGELCRQIANSGWRPDYVVGLTRGGLQAAVMISHYFDVPMHTLKVSLRDDSQQESNLWMSEDAFGYRSQFDGEAEVVTSNLEDRKNILIVDDINDSGATINWILDDWQKSCLPTDERWDNIWGNNVKFAVLFDNLASKANIKMDFASEEINKELNPEWIVFPYENWWA